MLEIETNNHKVLPNWPWDRSAELKRNVTRIWVKCPEKNKKAIVDLISHLGVGKSVAFYYRVIPSWSEAGYIPETKQYLQNRGISHYFYYRKTSLLTRWIDKKEQELKWFAADCSKLEVQSELINKYVSGFLASSFLMFEGDFYNAVLDIDALYANWPRNFSEFVDRNYCFIFDDKWSDVGEENMIYLSIFSNKITLEEMENILKQINSKEF